MGLYGGDVLRYLEAFGRCYLGSCVDEHATASCALFALQYSCIAVCYVGLQNQALAWLGGRGCRQHRPIQVERSRRAGKIYTAACRGRSREIDLPHGPSSRPTAAGVGAATARPSSSCRQTNHPNHRPTASHKQSLSEQSGWNRIVVEIAGVCSYGGV